MYISVSNDIERSGWAAISRNAINTPFHVSLKLLSTFNGKFLTISRTPLY